MAKLTAGILIIGDEILSGQVQDANIQPIAQGLAERGIHLLEVSVIPDIEQVIIDKVNAYRKAYTYVFTTGGIGPTHDDITVPSIAKALGLSIYEDQETVDLFKEHLKERCTAETLLMARFPEGAELFRTEGNLAPAFRIHNIFTMAGIPQIMRAQFDAMIATVEQDSSIKRLEVEAHTSEGRISKKLGQIDAEFADVSIGSYPFLHQGKGAVRLVAKGQNTENLQKAMQKIHSLLDEVGAERIKD